MQQETIMEQQEVLIDYDVVSPMAGHQPNRGVKAVEAAKDIFKKVKENAMQCAVKGEFITFTTIAELEKRLVEAAQNGFSIRVFDEDIGG